MKIRNYLIISAFFVCVFVLLMAFNPGAHNTNIEILPENSIISVKEKTSKLVIKSDIENEQATEEFAVITGINKNTETVKNTILSLEMLNHSYAIYETLDDLCKANSSAEYIFMATSLIYEKETEYLKQLLDDGKNLIFTEFPRGAYLESPVLRDILGIVGVPERYEVEGFDIYDLLLGGSFAAKEWEFECAKVMLSGKSKTYANGYNPDRDKTKLNIDKKDKNPIIWRTYYNNGTVFVINAPFMQNIGGMGLITGMIAENEGDYIYLVAGAKSVLLENFPHISENGKMIYDRSVYIFTRDVMWPDLISNARHFNLVFTCYTNGDFVRNTQSMSIISHFAESIYKNLKSEIGYMYSDDPIAKEDLQAIRKNLPDYKIHSFSVESLHNNLDIASFPNITSVIVPSFNKDAFVKISDKAVTIPIISKDYNNEQENMKFVGVYSACGLIIHSLDMKRPLESNLTDDKWNNYSTDIAKYFSFIFKNTSFMKSMPITKTSEAVKNYINTEYESQKDENGLKVFVSGNNGEVYFILRTHKNISKTKNCTSKKIEENVYLITTEENEFEIMLKEKDN